MAKKMRNEVEKVASLVHRARELGSRRYCS